MDPACGVIKEYIVHPGTGHIYNPDGTPVGRITGQVIVSPRSGFDKPGKRLGGRDLTSFELTFPGPGDWTIEVTMEDTAGHYHTETRFVRYRPDWPEGWHEAASMPLVPSGRPVKRGGWLVELEGQLYAGKGYKTQDFYSYDPVGDAWQELGALPMGNRRGRLREAKKGSRGVGDGGNHIYYVAGNNTLSFFRYHADRDSWAQLPDIPEGPYRKSVKGGNDLCYVVHQRVPYVYLLKGYKTELYRFNILADTWETLPEAPPGQRARWKDGSWLAYDGMAHIYAHKARYHELWRFDVADGAWHPDSLPSMPYRGRTGRRKKLKDGGCATWCGNKLYALKGGNTGEFWCYDIEARTWNELDTVPKLGSNDRGRRVKYGADIAAAGVGTFFALKGNKTRELWRYVIPEADGGYGTQGSAGAPSGKCTAAGMLLVPESPSRGVTSLRYVAPRPGPATVTVYDPAGRCVHRRSVVLGRRGCLTSDLRHLSAGVYLARLDAAGATATGKLVLQR